MNTIQKINNFIGIELTAKQWAIILKGCGCPQNAYFWQAFQQCLYITGIGSEKITYSLRNKLTEELYNSCLIYYRKLNNIAAKKYQKKKQAKNLAAQASKRIYSTCFFIVNGVITTEKPERE